MTKRTETNPTKQFTARIHRQHSSLVITVPKGLCKILDWDKGDILMFEVDDGDVAAVVGKSSLRGIDYDRDSGNSDREDHSG